MLKDSNGIADKSLRDLMLTVTLSFKPPESVPPNHHTGCPASAILMLVQMSSVSAHKPEGVTVRVHGLIPAAPMHNVFMCFLLWQHASDGRQGLCLDRTSRQRVIWL